MNVVYFTNSLSREGGGLFHSVRSLAGAVSRLGHDVSALAPSDRHLDDDRIHWGNVDTYDYPSWFPFKAGRVLLKRSPDVIHLNGLWLPHSYVVRLFSKSRDIPVIISPRGMLDEWALQNARFKKAVAGWAYEYRNLRNAACVHALCESEYEAVRAFGLKQPVAVIPNGVESPPSMRERQTWSWPYPESWRGNRILLFLSRIHPKKGLVPLIKAWHTVAAKSLDWRLAIVGPDENHHADEALALIDHYDLRSTVRWLGPKYGEDRDACYHHADGFVLPSFSEGFPMAALEALSFGLPAVLTPACHLPEAVDAGAAFLAEPKESSLAQTLRKAMSQSTDELRAMGQRGSQLVRDSFSWDSIAARVIEVYQWLANPGHHPVPADVRVD